MNARFYFKQASRALKRRKWRNLAAFAVALMVTQLLNLYSRTISQSTETLAGLYKQIPVNGYITSAEGNTEELTIDEDVVAKLVGTGYIAASVFKKSMAGYPGSINDLEGNALKNTVLNSSPLIGTNSIEALPGPPVYFEGWSGSLLSTAEAVCYVNQDDLDLWDWTPGNKLIYTVVDINSMSSCSVELLIVGAYKGSRRPAPIYCPLAVIDNLRQQLGLPLCFNSASFSLQNKNRLDHFRRLLLGLGFIPQTNGLGCGERLSFLIDDGQLKKATGNLQGHLDFIVSLYPLILLLLGSLGLVTAHLLIRLRKPEYAVMRTLGASKGVSFLVYFIEQALICLLGVTSSLFLLLLAGHLITARLFAVVGSYVLLYFIGASMAILAFSRAKVLTILTDKE